jgi:hypothetical protein
LPTSSSLASRHAVSMPISIERISRPASHGRRGSEASSAMRTRSSLSFRQAQSLPSIVNRRLPKPKGFPSGFCPSSGRLFPDNEVPEQLQRLNYILFTEDHSFGKSLSQLASALRTDLEWIRLHTRFAELAANWEERGRPEGLLLLGGEIDDAKAWLAKRPKDAPQITMLHSASESNRYSLPQGRRGTLLRA